MSVIPGVESVAAALATRAVVTALVVGARRLEVVALDQRERRALRNVVRVSIGEAALAHPAIAEISADIDLAGREEVIDELFAASAPNRRMQWPRTRDAWAELYGGSAPDALIDLMSDAAADMRIRLQRSTVLRPLWSTLAMEQISNQVNAVETKLDQITDPAAAIRFRGPEITRDPMQAISVAGALAEQLARGEPGNLLSVEAVGTDGSVRIHLQPGVELEMTVTKKVPDTPDGRAELERLNAAMATGEPIDMGEVSIETRLSGRAVQLFPETGHLSAGPSTRQVQVVLTVTSATREIEERLVLACEATRIGDAIHLVARSGSRGLLRADVELHLPTRRATFRFRLAERGQLRLADQILLHRVLAAFARGGAIEMYLVEFDLNSRTEFGPQVDFVAADAALPGLELLAGVYSMSGIAPEPVESFSGQDVALLGWARQLLTTNEAPMIAAGGSVTLRGSKQMWTDLMKAAKPDRSIDISYREETFPLQLSQRQLELGPVWHKIRGAHLPVAPKRKGRQTVVEVTWDAQASHVVSRVSPSESTEGETA